MEQLAGFSLGNAQTDSSILPPGAGGENPSEEPLLSPRRCSHQHSFGIESAQSQGRRWGGRHPSTISSPPSTSQLQVCHCHHSGVEAATQKATQGGQTEAENALKSQELALGGSAHPAGDAHQGKPPKGTVQPQDQEKPNPAGCRGYSQVAQLRSANPLRPALGWDTAVHTDPRDPPRLRG